MKRQCLGGINAYVSQKELERRLHAAQAILNDRGVDCMILYCHEAWQPGAIKYFTDIPGDVNYYINAAVLPKEGKIAYYAHGTTGTPAIPPAYGDRILEVNMALTAAPVFGFTKDLVPEQIVKFINHRGYKKIGLYRPTIIPHYLVEYIKDHVPGCTFETLDDPIDELKAVKSEEEIEICKETVRVHDQLYAALYPIVRVGRLERDIAADIKKMSLDMGCEGFNIMISTGNPYARHKSFHHQNCVVKEGDCIDLLIEVSGPGGYWGELSRMWYMGEEPTPELARIVKDNFYIQAEIAKMAKPGVKAIELRNKMVEFQKSHGYQEERRLFGHGQGTDLIERPAYAIGEEMTLKENMFVSIHPGLVLEDNSIWTMNTDNYLITKDGAVHLNKTPQQIYIGQY